MLFPTIGSGSCRTTRQKMRTGLRQENTALLPEIRQFKKCTASSKLRPSFPLNTCLVQGEGYKQKDTYPLMRRGNIREKHYKDSVRFSVSSAGKPHSSRAVTAPSTSKASASPETMTVLSSASNSRFATPGSDCKVLSTVARHPPQCMVGQENLTKATVLIGLVDGEPDSRAAVVSAAGTDAVGADAGWSAHPADKPSTAHNMNLRMMISCD